ncbi:phosphonate ABC transporter, permease protein PhnE [Roseomonas gilardii]|uniref:Phosphonate ABC transporter, permease protein PhnE n=1 Tax=Roseomonas gilardii TaxID=257708 RepID=A0A1L7AIM5_9PROT|nr:phosphonate ABC transporter, permease protein PhnE [Roseomonas gilardii]APT58581.1 phosphonate ABC transporter, permease protein PhnE [Roseomonas gilardii]MDT8333606.1 phosphonate ABC transporter, permease protein PhnE [Roseomonas gilardii]
MSGAIRNAALADLPGLAARHPQAFRRLPPSRLRALAITVAALALLALSIWRLELSPLRVFAGMGQMLHFLTLMLPPDPGSWTRFVQMLQLLAETLAIAFLGTLFAAILAIPLGFLAARNTTVNRVVHFLSRRALDGIRGVDALIWALIWISVVGLGPFAGVLAIVTSDIGTFGKLYSEAIEAVDRKAAEGVASTGGNRLHGIRYGVLPQVLPVLAGQVLYMFESNTRSSSIIGIVGAGGIGLMLSEMIRTLEWPAVSMIVVLILVMVAAIDALSSRLRTAIAGTPSGH